MVLSTQLHFKAVASALNLHISTVSTALMDMNTVLQSFTSLRVRV